MNSKIKSFAYNIFRAVSVNVIRLLVSVVLTLFLPKLMSVEEYSYWQLYQFYLTYIVYSSLGWCEGLYIKHGGKSFDKLNHKEVAGQFWALTIYETLFCSIFGFIVILAVTDGNVQVALTFAAVSAFLDILRYCLQVMLQTTNRIAEYAKIATAERLLFLLFVIIAIAIGRKDFESLIFAELLARMISLVIAVVLCKGIVFVKPPPVREIAKESKKVLQIGYKLLCANLASQLIIGVIRFSIEQHWGTVTFGKVSLTLSLSNMVITCIAAVSIVLFPMLKQADPKKLSGLYNIARMATTLPILFLLLFYTPIAVILKLWLPEYADSLKYLAVLLPVCIYEARSFMLTDTYFKVFGQGGKILLINITTVAVSLILAGLTVFTFSNLDMAVLCIVVLVAFKNIFAELLLQKQVNRRALPDILLEIMLTGIFILANWNLNGIIATIIYAISFVFYLFIRRKQLLTTIKQMKTLTKGSV